MNEFGKRLFIGFFICLSLTGVGQGLRVPTLSPITKISQEVGISTIDLSYSRPSAKGRKVFGELVPYGVRWRTGANAATQIHFPEPVEISGMALDSGKYAIYSIPGPDSWTIIFHMNTNMRSIAGDVYDETKDTLVFDVVPRTTDQYVETFTIQFTDLTTSSVHLAMMWENTLIKFPIVLDVDAQVDAQWEKMISSGEEINAFSYFRIAEYYLHNNKDLDKALGWINNALELSPENFRFGLLQAKIHYARGENDLAMSTINAAIRWAQNANNANYIGQTQLFKDQLMRETKLRGSWISYGSIVRDQVDDPLNNFAFRRYSFEGDQQVYISTHPAERGKPLPYKLLSDTSFMINNTQFVIANETPDSLVARSKSEQLILISERKFMADNQVEVRIPQYTPSAYLYQYILDSHNDLEGLLNGTFGFDLRLIGNKEDLTVTTNFTVDPAGNVGNIAVEGPVPEVNAKIRTKLEQSSGSWLNTSSELQEVRLAFRKVGSATRARERDGDEIFKTGLEHVKKERFDKALDSFNKAIDTYPEKGIYHQYRGAVLWELDRVDEGCRDMKTAIRYNIPGALDKYIEKCIQ